MKNDREKKEKNDITKSRRNNRFQRESILDTELSDEVAGEVKHGSQSQGLLSSYGAESASKKKQFTRPDRDY